ncbi:MAG: hypothetical protein A2784_00065 [Candidatus Chisholmbacteria bacterium RIFCSPHIGHO2_01_FULL_48_12]|uniref:Uncharacterized protein n=1 Tax=Candidatus Chisholmbacteria bacterium RIFCSPHIGHO2_01_FULL_48_12 TaxID=1797589 RepID=A0A1G1VKL0_9BACT|nr:MAG: hypothetical protein A2784_00065 [Candidatus Chisholmbacteria bacterium RIFCSPHIGHO2_01_FULL_48_12]
MPVQPITATTQQYLHLADIKDNLLLLKNGAAAMVIQTSAVNFGLLSEPEQDAIIYTYAGLLNSLTFPIQILIRSQRKDISYYLDLLKQQQLKVASPIHRLQIDKYRRFVESLVKEGNILDKKFYIIIPFSTLELGIGTATKISLNFFKAKTTSSLPFPKDYIIQRAKTSLEPKRNHLLHQLNRIGLRARALTTPELIQLFFDIYNPDSQGTKLAPPQDYTVPLVQPAVASPQPTAQPKPPIDNPPPPAQH